MRPRFGSWPIFLFLTKVSNIICAIVTDLLLFLDIVKISNLLGLDNLVKLQLDNNIITRIEGLDTLVNLKWLDLSFNLIKKVENLDRLQQLTDLSLFKNEVTTLSGLDHLGELNVLSVGSNKLESLEDTIKYLMGLKNRLEVLKIADNTFQKKNDKEYKKYTIAYLKDLKSLDYELIEEKKRELANEEHKEEMQDVENEQGSDKQDFEGQALDRDICEAHIQCTVNLLSNLVDECDEDYQRIKLFGKWQEVFQTSETNLEDHITRYQQEMKV